MRVSLIYMYVCVYVCVCVRVCVRVCVCVYNCERVGMRASMNVLKRDREEGRGR